MLCPSCQFENREGRRFCSKCGAPLAVACPSCDYRNDPDDAFCGGCGAPLSQPAAGAPEEAPVGAEKPAAPAAIDAELRQVAVLFADLSGFTKLSSTYGPEETHHLMGRFFAAVDDVVESYGGTVDKHIGDAVMALFGAPVAHGNEPERAARAALAIHEAMSALSAETERSLHVHIGIASGQVVAGGPGEDGHGDYTVTGDSVNLAARLVDMAGPGETLMADAVYREIPRLVEVDEIGDVSVKGLEHPVAVWRLRCLSTTGQRQAQHPVVGRRPELGQFRGVLETFRESGAGQAIYVRGEAGIGKTRLVEEFAAMAAREGFACHAGLVLDFGVGKGRDAIRGIVRSLLDVPVGADGADQAGTAGRAVAEGLVEAEQLVFLYDLLDVPLDAEMRAIYDAMTNDRRNRGKQDCVATLLARTSRRQPWLITVEDLHSADSPTLEHLAVMASTVTTCPALLIMTSRIDGDPLDHRWRSRAGPISLATMELAPLREHEALAFAGEFVDASNRFVATCIRRAEGNPLFLEQLLRGALASETETVPGSVQSIVLARVDRLSSADKQAVQAAAVLGQRFSLEVLRHLIDDPSYEGEALFAHNLLRPADGDLLFAHALIWESVYASLLTRRRHDMHRRAAAWFAGRDPTLRAQHLERADDPEAVRAYIEAARAQAELLHMGIALRLAERGLAVAEAAADRYELLSLKGEYLVQSGSPADSVAAYREALQVAESEVDQCRAWIGLAAGMRVTDDYDDALEALDRAQELAGRHGLDEELSRIRYYRGCLYFPLGNIEGCLAEHESALDYARRAGSVDTEARALSGLGDAYYSRGLMITSLDYFRRCIELCRAHRLVQIEVANQYMVAWNRVYMNEIEGALDDALSAIRAAVRVGNQRAELVAELAAAWVLVEKGDVGAAEPHVERGLALAESLGASRFLAFFMIFLGRIRLAQRGPCRETAELMEEALEISRRTGIGFLGPWVLSTLALVSDDAARSRSALAEGEEILEAGSVGHNCMAFHRDAMEVALRGGDWDAALRYADRLANGTRQEPLPWADYYIDWGRTLATHGRDGAGPPAGRELPRLKAEAERVGLLGAVTAIDRLHPAA